MKRFAIALSLALASATASAQSPAPEQWWSYLATYDAGPGSIRVNLALRKQAPLAGYPYLVVTGPKYASTQKGGLPEVADVNRLNDLQAKVVAAIAELSPHVYVGTFTHDFEQLHYVYVKSPSGISQALAMVYGEHCGGCKTYTNIKQDPSWIAYLDFLFPNQETRERYGLQLK
jgi:hypothetical protein